MELRVELQRVVTKLLVESEQAKDIALDHIGDALGTLSVSTDEIDGIFRQLENEGRRVVAPPGGGGEALLKRVTAAARALKQESTVRPTLSTVAEHAELTQDDVLNALFLLRIMQR
ncbi:MAG: hypothetical protein RLZZ450_6005 [Pseudomonadota bacterium]|jgi:hypothetical protein